MITLLDLQSLNQCLYITVYITYTTYDKLHRTEPSQMIPFLIAGQMIYYCYIMSGIIILPKVSFLLDSFTNAMHDYAMVVKSGVSYVLYITTQKLAIHKHLCKV